MKKFISGLVIGLFLSLSTAVLADGALKQMWVVENHAKVYVDGILMKQPTYTIDGKVYISIRETLEAAGCGVKWDSATTSVLVTNPERHAYQQQVSQIAPTYEVPAYTQPTNTSSYQTELTELEDAYKKGVAEQDQRLVDAQKEVDKHMWNDVTTTVQEGPSTCPICSTALMKSRTYTNGGNTTIWLSCYNPNCPKYGMDIGQASYHSTLTEAIKKQEEIEADVAIQKQALTTAYNKVKTDLQIKYGIY
jgi:hypothetical protein